MTHDYPHFPRLLAQAARYGVPDNIARSRRTKLALGMTITYYRAKKYRHSHRTGYGLNDTALSLSVKGTSDRLGASGYTNRKVRTVSYYRLSDAGKRKLARLKKGLKY